MTPRIGSIIYDAAGRPFRLAQEIGRGAQGSVWSLVGRSSLVAKLYHQGLSIKDRQKLTAMCNIRTDDLCGVAAWPAAMLTEQRGGQATGFLMPKVTGFRSIHVLYGLKSRLRAFPEAQFPFLLHAALNTARAFTTVHESGQVVGDVNHSNLMVSEKATVAFVDCDSFQVTANGTVYECPVGVPEFTPPELHGVTFASVRRTQQHDSFGLAVLLFQLLFLGRHPFMGVYDARRDEIVPLEQAIQACRFPYILGERPAEVRLPPFAPRLGDFPLHIGALFARSFQQYVGATTRPAAKDWIGPLTDLSKNLKRCAGNSTHHYYSSLTTCPWCRVEGSIGTAIFGISFVFVTKDAFDLKATWTQIEAVSPSVESLELPNVEALIAAATMNPGIRAAISNRRGWRVSSILAVMLVTAFVGVAHMSLEGALTTSTITLILSYQLWRRGAKEVLTFETMNQNARIAYDGAVRCLKTTGGRPTGFTEIKTSLERARAEYAELPQERRKRIDALNANRLAKQQKRFLEGYRLDDVTLLGIGPKNKQILKAWGVEDAADVDRNRLVGIKGIGPVKQETLLAWRASLEAQFRFDPTQPIDPQELRALDHEMSLRAETLRGMLRTGPQRLNQVVLPWRAQRAETFARVHQLARTLAQTESDQRALRTF